MMHQEFSMIRNLSMHNPRMDYLADVDRFLTGRQKPQVVLTIIGTGVNGQEHIRNTVFEGRAVIKGIYDIESRSLDAAQRYAKNLGLEKPLVMYGSLQEACCDPEVDGLIISTPNYTHIDIIREIAKYGKHILLEKPMATTIKDAWEIVGIAKDYEGVFQIGLQYRFKALYSEAMYEALDRKILGEIKTISISEHRVPFYDKVRQWNKFNMYSGGTLVEKCCHYFDLFNLFAQSKPKKVYASGGMAVNFIDFTYEDDVSDILDNAFVIVEYANGVRARFDLCMFAPLFHEELVLCGSKGRLEASECQDFISGANSTGVEVKMRINCDGPHASRTSSPHYPAAIEELGHHGATFFEHVGFVNSILGLPSDAARVDEGFWAVVLGVAAQRSIMTGMPVMIDELLQEEGVPRDSRN